MSDLPEIHLHQQDLPSDLDLGNEVAVDCEMMGLQPHRDRLCLVQLRGRGTDIHLVKIAVDQDSAPNLKTVLEDSETVKIFHFGRSDLATLKRWLDIDCRPIFCTRTASRLARTYTNKHGLRFNCKDLLGVDLDKQNQTTDWGADELTEEQLEYAARDVLYLHELKDKLVEMLEREERLHLAIAANEFIPERAEMDLLGWADDDIFAHS